MQNPEKVLTMTEKASNNLMNYKTLSIIPLFWREIRLNIVKAPLEGWTDCIKM